MAKTKKKKIIDLMSNMAKYLKDAGYIDASQKVNDAMAALDGAFDDEDYLVDSIVGNTPDVQNALPGSLPVSMTGEIAGGMQGMFSIPEAEKLAEIGNSLDKLGLHEEADEIDEILGEMLLDDDMFGIIEDLEESEDKKRRNKVEDKDDDEKAEEEVLVGANGRVGTGVTDNQNAGSFQGFSDAYFYSGYGNLEAPFGPTDR